MSKRQRGPEAYAKRQRELKKRRKRQEKQQRRQEKGKSPPEDDAAERPEEPTTNHGWYGAYWSDSERSHPSLSTAAQHHENAPHDAMLGSTVLLALSAYSQLLPGDPCSDQIQQCAEELVKSVRTGG